MSSCYECVHSQVRGSKVKCSYTGEDIYNRDHICGKFATSESNNVCEDCDYYQFGAFSRFNSNGRCALTGERRRDDDVACSNFSN